MRKVVYGGACSVDGFLAGPGGAIDWLHFSDDVKRMMAERWANVDTMLFGRKTWEFSMAAGGGKGSRVRGVKGYLFSRTMTESPQGIELVRDDAGGFVRALKAAPGKDIVVMSGGNLAASLFAEGVIDEVGLNVHPLLLGSGVPTFVDAGVRVPLALEECRSIDGGCVMLRYRVVRL